MVVVVVVVVGGDGGDGDGVEGVDGDDEGRQPDAAAVICLSCLSCLSCQKQRLSPSPSPPPLPHLTTHPPTNSTAYQAPVHSTHHTSDSCRCTKSLPKLTRPRSLDLPSAHGAAFFSTHCGL